MKSRFIYSFLIIAFTSLLIGCKKTNVSDNGTNNGSIEFTANGKNIVYSGMFDVNLETGVQMLESYDSASWQTTYAFFGYENSNNGLQIGMVFNNKLKLEEGKTYNLAFLTTLY